MVVEGSDSEYSFLSSHFLGGEGTPWQADSGIREGDLKSISGLGKG